MKIVVIGGCAKPLEEGCLKCCEVFDENGNGTLIENVLDYPRRGAAVAFKHDFIYVFGGCSEPKNHLKTVEKIDKHFKATVIETEIESEGSCFAFCEINKDSFFIGGGFNGRECLDSASVFTFSSVSLSSSFRLPTPLKNSAACQNPFDSHSVLLFGGWDSRRTLNAIFNLSLNDFSTTMDGLLPYHVEGHTATIIEKSIFLIGGYNGVRPVSTIAKYDHQNGTTQILPVELEIARENHCTIFLKSKNELWIIGGWNGKESLSSIERFKVSINDGDVKMDKLSLNCLCLNKARQKASVVIID